MSVESGVVLAPSTLILSACNSRGSFSVLSNSNTFAPFLCDHCNVNEIARQCLCFFCLLFNTGMMDKGMPNRNRI